VFFAQLNDEAATFEVKGHDEEAGAQGFHNGLGGDGRLAFANSFLNKKEGQEAADREARNRRHLPMSERHPPPDSPHSSSSPAGAGGGAAAVVQQPLMPRHRLLPPMLARDHVRGFVPKHALVTYL
jgi:hypothetical protein